MATLLIYDKELAKSNLSLAALTLALSSNQASRKSNLKNNHFLYL